MVADYASLKTDLFRVADESAAVVEVVTSGTGSFNSAIDDINERLGSGDPLTWDETGFTWDSDQLSFDQTEA